MQPINYYANQLEDALDIRALPFAAPDFTRARAMITAPDLTHAEISVLLSTLADQPAFWRVMGNGMDNSHEVMDALRSAGFTHEVVIGTANYYPNLNYFTRTGDEALAFGN